MRYITLFLLAGVLVAGCDKSERQAVSDTVEKAVNAFFVAFDPVGVTNVALSASSDVTMGYSALDGSGEWRWIFEPSDVSTAEDALAYIEATCTPCAPSDKVVLIPMYLRQTRLPGSMPGDFAVWNVAKEIFLVVETERGDPSKILMCDFVLCDGRALRRLAPFAKLPTSDKLWDCIRQARSNPAALNNIAAMLFNDVALRSEVSAEHIGFYLVMAAGAGDPIACRNLAIYNASALATDADKDYKRDFWLRRTSETVQEKQRGFSPALEDRPIQDWPN